MNEQNYRFETLQLHAGQEHPDPLSGARAVPIYATTSYVFDDCAQAADRFALKEGGNIYGRLDNPTQEAFERRMAALEGGSSALALASGAAAVTYVLQALAQGYGHIVAQKTIYGGSYNLMAHTLPALGIETTFVNIHDLAETEAAIQPHTRLLCGNIGQPRQRYPGSGQAGRNRSPSWHPAGRGQHLCHAILAPPLYAWCGYRRLFGYEIHRRPWHCAGRRDHRIRTV